MKEARLMELAVAMKSYKDLMDAQKHMFENQIEKLQQIVATQCKLTGVNPLSQEMAAGALSIKIGKRPRDLLNPKAVNYMQSLFSIKDTFNKRETRETSAQFGVTVTQVRDFFNGQRSRVRKFARSSKERVNRSATSDGTRGEITSTSDLNTAVEPIPLNTMVPTNVNEVPSCSKSNDILCEMEESDQQFVDNIFNLMRKENSFSGQLKLLKWILRVENSSVLNWFLAEGGLMILATWLSEASIEEQTSFIRVVLRVLHYLPMIKASPVHMSAVLQSVNSLRFYRTSDISHRARILLSKWSRIFGKKLSLMKNNGLKSSSYLEDEMLLKKSIHEVMGDDLWDLKDKNDEDTLRFLSDNTDDHRKSDEAQPVKLLMAPGDESNKRRGVLLSNMKERRKVQMVEHLGQTSAVRGPQVARTTPTTQSRPLSADDIQKAKMRAQFMHSKHGKNTTPPDEKAITESRNKFASLLINLPPPVPKPVGARTELIKEGRRPDNEVRKDGKPLGTFSDMKETPWKKLMSVKIPWKKPPEVQVPEEWCLGDGASSKEVEIQKNRIRRERETIYASIEEIPSDPKEPWDREMSPDDTLTPEIPIEQLPDVEPFESPPGESSENLPIKHCETVDPVASTLSENLPEPDLELLAELLKNPQLVFALTSGNAGDLSSDTTVKLLDMIKANGVSSLGKLAGNVDRKVEVSLPSPTPSSEPVPTGSRPDLSRNPFSRHHSSPNDSAYQATVFPPHPVLPSQQSAHVTGPPTSSLDTSFQPRQEQLTPLTTTQMHQQSRFNTFHAQHLTTDTMPNSDDRAGSSGGGYNNINPSPFSILTPPSRSGTPPKPPHPRGYSSENLSRTRHNFDSNYHYRNTRDASRNAMQDRARLESWGPEGSPIRGNELFSGRYYHQEANANPNPRHVYRNDRPMGGGGNKRWRDYRR